MSNLYIVGTPIGNLEDATFRAVRILGEVDLILAEDTRVTKRLLDKYGVKTPLLRFDAKVEAKNSKKIAGLLKEGKDIALVSDAGTPGVSDPGQTLVWRVREELPDVKIISIPGVSAITAVLSVAGLSDTGFLFLGFLPHKKGRETLFKKIAESDKTIVFYESVHRFLKTLESLKKFLGSSGGARRIVVGRELPKMFEEVVSGPAEEVIGHFSENPNRVKGEFVIVVEGR